MLELFGIQACNSVTTPLPLLVLDSHKHLKIKSKTTSYTYQEAISALMHATNFTCLDIAFSVNFLATAQNDPSDLHWALPDRSFQYSTETENFGLLYDGKSDVMDVYDDADFRGVSKTCKSTSGYIA